MKNTFSETLLPKNHGQVSFDQKGYCGTVLFSFTAPPPAITTATHIGEQLSSPNSIKRKGFVTKLCSSFSVTYQEICDVEMKRWALKSEKDCSF